MTLARLYGQSKPAISFEVFPPKQADGIERLRTTIQNLVDLKPDLLTVTYGAMGTTQTTTQSLVIEFRERYQIRIASHLTCVQATRESIRNYVNTLLDHDVRYVVALRGDIPAGAQASEAMGDFNHASDLVAFIKTRFPQMSIAVAGYPEKHVEAEDFPTDIGYLRRKVDAGADAVITQLFYSNEDYYRFRERCQAAGITVPIVPGLMPVSNLHQVKRITSMCGATIPDELLAQLEKCGDNSQTVLDCGVQWTLAQARDLLENEVPGIHFYVLNKADAAAQIMNGLKNQAEALNI